MKKILLSTLMILAMVACFSDAEAIMVDVDISMTLNSNIYNQDYSETYFAQGYEIDLSFSYDDEGLGATYYHDGVNGEDDDGLLDDTYWGSLPSYTDGFGNEVRRYDITPGSIVFDPTFTIFLDNLRNAYGSNQQYVQLTYNNDGDIIDSNISIVSDGYRIATSYYIYPAYTDLLFYYYDGDYAQRSTQLADINYSITPSNPVPEPSTILLMGLGLAGLIGIRARKKS